LFQLVITRDKASTNFYVDFALEGSKQASKQASKKEKDFMQLGSTSSQGL
jgi:hypothetical protein